MKAKQLITTSFAFLMAVGMVVPVLAQGKEFDLQKADVHDRMLYHRAIDAGHAAHEFQVLPGRPC